MAFILRSAAETWSLFDAVAAFASKIASRCFEIPGALPTGAYFGPGFALFVLTFLVNASPALAGGKTGESLNEHPARPTGKKQAVVTPQSARRRGSKAASRQRYYCFTSFVIALTYRWSWLLWVVIAGVGLQIVGLVDPFAAALLPIRRWCITPGTGTRPEVAQPVPLGPMIPTPGEYGTGRVMGDYLHRRH